MKRSFAWLLLPLLIISCHGDQDHAESSTYSLDTRTVELSGSLPVLSGTPGVTIAGTPATIVGTTWRGMVTLIGPQTDVAVILTIDGTQVAKRLVSIDTAKIPAHPDR